MRNPFTQHLHDRNDELFRALRRSEIAYSDTQQALNTRIKTCEMLEDRAIQHEESIRVLRDNHNKSLDDCAEARREAKRLTENYDRLYSAYAAVNVGSSKLKAEYDALRANYEAKCAAVSKLDKEIDLKNDQIADLSSRVMGLVGKAQPTSAEAELRAENAQMQRTINSLQAQLIAAAGKLRDAEKGKQATSLEKARAYFGFPEAVQAAVAGLTLRGINGSDSDIRATITNPDGSITVRAIDGSECRFEAPIQRPVPSERAAGLHI